MAALTLRARRYVSATPTTWWLRRWTYLRFMLRESSSFFVAYAVVLVLLQMQALKSGAEAYQNFQAWLASPLMLTVNLITLLFVIFHAASWFNLVPQAMLPRIKGRPLSKLATAWPLYLLWIVISLVVAWFVVRQ
jgi:fumarate reductase subunit C